MTAFEESLPPREEPFAASAYNQCDNFAKLIAQSTWNLRDAVVDEKRIELIQNAWAILLKLFVLELSYRNPQTFHVMPLLSLQCQDMDQWRSLKFTLQSLLHSSRGKKFWDVNSRETFTGWVPLFAEYCKGPQKASLGAISPPLEGPLMRHYFTSWVAILFCNNRVS